MTTKIRSRTLTRSFRYHLVDVFADQPFVGSALAVFPEADGMSDHDMQRVAGELNLIQTVFCVTPSRSDAHTRMRIFTPKQEMPMGSYPVVGAHYVLAETGQLPVEGEDCTLNVELDAGVMPVDVLFDEGELHSVLLTMPAPSFEEPVQDRAGVAAALGICEDGIGPGDLHVRVVDSGMPWLLVPIVDLPQVRGLRPDPDLCAELAAQVGTEMFFAFTQETISVDCAAHARHVWFGAVTSGEDPTSGSGCAALASYLVEEEVLLAAPTANVQIEQGAPDRPGQVEVLVEVNNRQICRVRVGGRALHIGDGELRLP